MLPFLDVRHRRREPEVMDRPDLDPQAHRAALRGLARLNWWSRSTAILWPPICEQARLSGRTLRVLDLACGAGDVTVGLWVMARRAGVPLQLAGCDVSPVAVAHARERAAAAGADVTFFEHDVLAGPAPGTYDVVLCSLFLHHLAEADAVRLLRTASATGRRLLVNDLRRCTRGLLLAWAASRLLTRSPVVHTDAVLSVRAAFTLAEARGLAGAAGLTDFRIGSRWPCRWLLDRRHPGPP